MFEQTESGIRAGEEIFPILGKTYSKLTSPICKYHLHINEFTKNEKIFGNEYLSCKKGKKGCPYGNAEDIKLGGEIIGTICKTRGLIKKVKKFS